MNKFVATLVAGVAFAAIASPAAAAVGTGPRIEIIGGGELAQVDFTDLGAPVELDETGFVVGFGVGYDFSAGNVGFGVEAEVSTSSADLTIIDDATGDGAELDVRRDLYAGGRVTFAVSPTANVYVKGGYTQARVRATVTLNGISETDSANADGIRGGIGAQFAVGDGSYVGAEYRYSNYEADFSRHQAVVTIGHRF
jgi:outer membrane immunogenic protein